MFLKTKFGSAFLHPWIIISYFIAYKYVVNIHQLNFDMFLMPEFISIVLVTLLFLLLNLLIKDPTITVAVISLSIIVIFSYHRMSLTFPVLSQYQDGNTNSYTFYLWMSFVFGIVCLI